ncbi:MAG: sulfite exporter TauE/SafE family protein [Candidatus Eremiobacterota bacterium]
MSIIMFTIIICIGSMFAGYLGSLTGLGGGVVIIPMLTVIFGVDIRYAIGASLVSVIATSSGAAAAYVREGFSNIRIGMFLEIATTIGALLGAFLALHLPIHVISIIFGIVLIHSAYVSSRPRDERLSSSNPDRLSVLTLFVLSILMYSLLKG